MLRFVVVAFLGGAAIGIVIGYALGRLHHRREGPPKPVQVRIERAQAAEAAETLMISSIKHRG